MSTLVVKVGGAVAADSASAILDLVANSHKVCVVHGAGPQISLEMERAGILIEFVDGRRVTTPEGLELVRASFRRVNAALCDAIGEQAVGLFGDEIGLQAQRVPALGLVGNALPSRPAALVEALAADRVPVVAPLAEGPLNVNADEAAAALALGIDADELLFLTDVDGLMINGHVVDSIGVDAASELLDGGTLHGGIIPKLTAAVVAAREGVDAWIGQTVVTG